MASLSDRARAAEALSAIETVKLEHVRRAKDDLGLDWSPYTKDEYLVKAFTDTAPLFNDLASLNLMKFGATLWVGSMDESASRGLPPELAAVEASFVVRAFYSYLVQIGEERYSMTALGGAMTPMSREQNVDVRRTSELLGYKLFELDDKPPSWQDQAQQIAGRVTADAGLSPRIAIPGYGVLVYVALMKESGSLEFLLSHFDLVVSSFVDNLNKPARKELGFTLFGGTPDNVTAYLKKLIMEGVREGLYPGVEENDALRMIAQV